MLLYFEHKVFLVLDMVFSYYNKDPKEVKQGDQQDKYCLLFHLCKCVISKTIFYVEQVVSIVGKPNHSAGQNAESCQSHCWHMQRFLLNFSILLLIYLAPEF